MLVWKAVVLAVTEKRMKRGN